MVTRFRPRPQTDLCYQFKVPMPTHIYEDKGTAFSPDQTRPKRTPSENREGCQLFGGRERVGALGLDSLG